MQITLGTLLVKFVDLKKVAKYSGYSEETIEKLFSFSPNMEDLSSIKGNLASLKDFFESNSM